MAKKRVLVPAGEPFERNLQKLWAICGCGDPERNPKYMTKPTQAELLSCGKRTTVRPILRAISDQIVRASGRSLLVEMSPLYQSYTAAREKYQGHVHARECQNKKRPPLKPNGCGTVAHREWGAVGSPWRPGHINAHAHRIVHKELLRGLWSECVDPQWLEEPNDEGYWFTAGPDAIPAAEWGDLIKLRMLAEGLADAISDRIRTTNRVHSGEAADFFYGKEMIAAEKRKEDQYRAWLSECYQEVVPQRVQIWAQGTPGIASGEMFPRLIGLIGNPRIATPLRTEYV